MRLEGRRFFPQLSVLPLEAVLGITSALALVVANVGHVWVGSVATR
jgi:hypothetical protein